MENKKKTTALYVAIIAMMLLSAYLMTTMLKPQTKVYTHSEIVYMFQDGLVDAYTLDLSGRVEIKIDMTHPNAEGIEQTGVDTDGVKYIVTSIPYIVEFQNDVRDYIKEHNIENPEDRMDYNFVAPTDNSWIIQLAVMIIPVTLIAIMFFVVIKQTGGAGKMSQFSKANAKGLIPGKKTTFAEVAGADEEKEELNEIVDFLKRPEKFSEIGARIPKGVLLVGPPGTGKTLLARAVAGEAGVPFYSISGSDFVEMFVGVGASRVRDLFAQAKKTAPSIVFIDEIDAVGRHRGAGLGGGHDEREQTLNQLLVEMDGFGDNEGVIIIAATNRRDILDPALLRPGRFDRQVVVGYPDVKGRHEILKVHGRNKPMGFDVDLDKIAKATVGFTGADLENLLNEAALLAARSSRKAITAVDIEAATIKVVAGPEKKSHKVNEYDKEITAFHEAGHAVVTYYLKSQDPVHEISIIPRGMAAGYTMNLPEDDKTHVSKRRLSEKLVVLLGGRVAEEIALDDICTGASNDIERVTATARDMVTRFGFSNKLGPIVYGSPEGEVFLGRSQSHQQNYSDSIAEEIDNELRALIDTAYEHARQLLTEHRDQLDLIAYYLLENEKINAKTFKDLMSGELEFIPMSKEERTALRLAKEEEEKKALELLENVDGTSENTDDTSTNSSDESKVDTQAETKVDDDSTKNETE